MAPADLGPKVYRRRPSGRKTFKQIARPSTVLYILSDTRKEFFSWTQKSKAVCLFSSEFPQKSGAATTQQLHRIATGVVNEERVWPDLPQRCRYSTMFSSTGLRSIQSAPVRQPNLTPAISVCVSSGTDTRIRRWPKSDDLVSEVGGEVHSARKRRVAATERGGIPSQAEDGRRG